MAKRILIVDDEPDILAVITYRLKKLGYEVDVATDGEKAISSIKNKKPDLVLLDLMMPVMDGFQACKIIKSDEKTKNIPVVVVTAKVTDDLPIKLAQIKADDYVLKPYNPEELLKTIKKYIGEGS